jgi:hypothetical protein
VVQLMDVREELRRLMAQLEARGHTDLLCHGQRHSSSAVCMP